MANGICISLDRVCEGLKGVVVVPLTLWNPVITRGKGGSRCLQHSIVRNPQLPFRAVGTGLTFAEIPLDNCEKIRNLLGTCPMLYKKSVSQPVVQAYLRLRLQTTSGLPSPS